MPSSIPSQNIGVCTVILAAVSLLISSSPAEAKPTSASHLQVIPQKIVLRGPYSETRVLVDQQSKAGSPVEVGASSVMSILNPKVAVVDDEGIVRPIGNGKTELVVKYQGLDSKVPIAVSGVMKANSPSFLTDVMPVLSKAGCNQGACHGAAAGKGGFKLSLLGYDPDWDYDAITRSSGARRIARAQPDNSLFLLKPTMGVVHRGGMRFKTDSASYRILRDWIVSGLSGPKSNDPHVVRLEVSPAVRSLKVGNAQRFAVKAVYSDGSQRNVTSETLFSSSDESVATVSADGDAKVVGQGEGAVLVRYQSVVSTARLISPYGPPKTASKVSTGKKYEQTAQSSIDRLIQAKLDALGLQTSGTSSDSDFMRRASIDTIGLLPTPTETRAFLADHDPKKREKWVNSLLVRSEFVDNWSMKWGDILQSSRQKLSEKGVYTFNEWIRQSVDENKPWDKFAQELILAQGDVYEYGPANFYRTAPSPQELAETTSQVFMGVRIQCAKCHNHPYDKWTQNQYYQMAAFFARVQVKRQNESVIYLSNSGEVTHPKTQLAMIPAALDAAPLAKDYHGDRRVVLAQWLTSPQNPFFAKSVVNRVWKHFMGRGLVEPVDDLRVTNPPSNSALFDYLAEDLAAHHFDLKYLMRSILLSHAYQREARSSNGNERDSKYYSHFLFKRLSAEQLQDALTAATGVPEKFAGFPAGMRAEQLPDNSAPSYFLDLFGRPARLSSCACERTDAPNIGQVLHLMNDSGINTRISAPAGRVAGLVKTKVPDNKMVEELYLGALSRYPSPEESRRSAQVLASAKNKELAGEDLLWALLNSKEFLFNH